jgi:hypothetical protein
MDDKKISQGSIKALRLAVKSKVIFAYAIASLRSYRTRDQTCYK